MDMVFTEEQEMLQTSVRRFFEKEVPSSLVMELQQADSTGHSTELWKKIVKAGWLSIPIPEQYGGAGGALMDAGIVYEEAGHVLLPTTFYSTMFAALLIEELGTEEQKELYLSRIAGSGAIYSVAYIEPQAINDPANYQCIARKEKDRYYLSGVKSFVSNAALSDLFIVIALTEDEDGKEGLTAFLVPPQVAGITIKEQQTFGKDKQSLIEFTEVELSEENVLGSSEKAKPGFLKTVEKATALQCMEMVGGMKKVVKMTAEYVSERKQFGVAIGSFQAVQHHMANLATARDGSQLLAYQALSLLSDGKPASREVSLAKAHSSESYKNITVMAHQLWGGMGYAIETDLFLWSNRAKATELSFGTRTYHMKRIASLIPALTEQTSEAVSSEKINVEMGR